MNQFLSRISKLVLHLTFFSFIASEFCMSATRPFPSRRASTQLELFKGTECLELYNALQFPVLGTSKEGLRKFFESQDQKLAIGALLKGWGPDSGESTETCFVWIDLQKSVGPIRTDETQVYWKRNLLIAELNPTESKTLYQNLALEEEKGMVRIWKSFHTLNGKVEINCSYLSDPIQYKCRVVVTK